MKKVTFAKNFNNNLDVLLSGKKCGVLKFGNEDYGTQKGIWILWIENIDGTEGVSYFKDLQKTKDTITEELCSNY